VSRSLLLRLLENFFRRWYLYLVPVVLLGLVGVFSVASTKKQFQSLGTFNVESSTVLSTLSGSSDSNFGYDSPALSTSKRIGSLLQTDQFIKDVAAKAKLDTALTASQITIGEIRSSMAAWPNGANLVNVTATNRNPAVAQALVGATIDAFVQGIVDSQASQSKVATAFFTDLVQTYQVDLDKARHAVDDYVAAHPAPAIGLRADDEQADLTRLNADFTQAQSRYDDAVNKKQDAELSTEKTKADVGERLRLVDSPQLPQAPLGGLKTSLTSFATFLVLGVLLAGGAVVVGTLLDRTIRTPSDVSKLEVRLLTVVPDTDAKQSKVKEKKVKEKKRAKKRAPAKVVEPTPASEKTRRARPAGPRAAAGPPRGAVASARARQTPRPGTKTAGGSGWPG
jgi:uncharacterized protein involved in exopolysaccharide biosynthesis